MNDFEKTEQKLITKLVSLGFEKNEVNDYELVVDDMLISVFMWSNGDIILSAYDYMTERETKALYTTIAGVMRKINQLMA